MKKIMFFSAIVLCVAMTSCDKKAAPQDNEQKEELSAVAKPEVSAMRVALDLAKYGYENESPSALIEAANILASTPVQNLEGNIEQGAENANEGDKADKKSIEPKQLLADARELAGEDANLLALADKIDAKLAIPEEEVRGAVGGAKYAYGKVYAHSYTYYDQKFWSNELAEILVSGDGDTDLDLYVYDENGNLIVSDTDYTDDCYVRFAPRWTGLFRIKIVNRGGVYNNYTIVTN